MSNMVMADIALALTKGLDLTHRCGDDFANITQRMLTCEAITQRVNSDLRIIMKVHGETIAKTIPVVYEEYKDGIISQAECLGAYLSFLTGSESQPEKNNAQALSNSLSLLEEKLRSIHCPQSYWGKGCLINE